MDRLLKLHEVEDVTALSRSTIYEWMRKGKFPQPLVLSTRSVRWRASAVAEWMDRLPGRSA